MTTIITVAVFLVAVIGFGLVMKKIRTSGIKVPKEPVTPPPPKKPLEKSLKKS